MVTQTVALAPARPPRWRKWWAVFNLHLQDSFAYRAQGIVWILTDTVPTITLPLMWLAAFGNRQVLNGFTRTELVAYYLCMSVCANLAQAHPWEIAHDIKDGKLSIYLTRPFSYYWFNFASNVSWRLVRSLMFVPFFGLALLVLRSHLAWEDFHIGWTFWVSLALAHVLSYQISWCLGQSAFFLVEVGGLFEFYYMIGGFLAGQMAPLQMLPKVISQIAHMLPFSYVLWFPVNIFLGRVPQASVAVGLAYQLCWIAVTAMLGQILWRVGLKRYTAVGL
ncbi:MAG: ABC-2 family transporter protein [Armatimonadetes bacterium]|nr:ABC-2 family transporter protein [Armatimonadota bacterium]